MKKIFLNIFLLLMTGKIFSQNSQALINIDTAFMLSKMNDSSQVIDKRGLAGFEIHYNEKKISTISKIDDDVNSGLYINFYLSNNNPKEKGFFKRYFDKETIEHVEKDGEWLYWDEHGKLIKKQIWKKGQLLKTIIYK